MSHSEKAVLMATRKMKAVVENGTLRPLEPLGLSEGAAVEVKVRIPEPVRTPEERARSFREALDALQEEAAKYPDESWEQFEADINAGRTKWEEIGDPLSAR
jgi:predicted DNA-binding antitoxin AbrB/MazE fold protein